MSSFDGLGTHLGNISRLAGAKTRAITAENPTGEPGRAGMATEGTGAELAEGLGQVWKVSPSVPIAAGQTVTLAEIEGPGAIQSVWFGGTTARDHPRESILRIYWDDQEIPSIECPLGDFFCAGWSGFAQLSSLPVAVNPNRGLNCFWEMPFRRHCRVTIENRYREDLVCYYQINYALAAIEDDCAYFHAQFRRVNPVPLKTVYTILDGVQGAGQYVGTYFAVGVTNDRWWGAGEVKFFIDGDTDFPTICGTGTEDYVGGSYDWKVEGRYTEYTTPYMGLHQLIRPDGAYQSRQRFGLYRWHIVDPIRFGRDLRVTVQALGWRGDERYLPLQFDMATVAYWSQSLPTQTFPPLPDSDALEVA